MTSDELILKSLNGVLQSRKLYPPGHPTVVGSAKKTMNLIAEHIKGSGELTIAIVDGALIFDEMPVDEAEKQYADLLQHMESMDIEAITFIKGVVDKEFVTFTDILSSETPARGEALQEELTKKGVKHITLKSVESEKAGYVEVYNGALECVKNVMSEIRMGKIPRSEGVKKVVDDMTEMVFKNTNAMLGLTMIKNYDNYLYNHSVNVSILSVSIGKQMGLDKASLKALGVGSLLHDVGKTGISEDIIKKPGGLSNEEWEKLKEHPSKGSEIAARMDGLEEGSKKIVLEHHVRYDHSGYPDVKEDLHPLSMIVSIADAYDALTTLRVYQKPYHPVEAIKILKNLSGKHFEPKTFAAFEAMVGLYPVGTMVRLSSNEIGVVTKIDQEHTDLPTVKIIYDDEGNGVADPKEVVLSQTDESLFIISPVDPLSKDIDLGQFFEKEAANQ